MDSPEAEYKGIGDEIVTAVPCPPSLTDPGGGGGAATPQNSPESAECGSFPVQIGRVKNLADQVLIDTCRSLGVETMRKRGESVDYLAAKSSRSGDDRTAYPGRDCKCGG